MKRYLSLLLTVTLLLSLLVVPTRAAANLEMKLEAVTFTQGKGGFEEGAPIGVLKAGDVFAVKTTFNNHSETDISVGGYAFELEYDKNLFDPYTFEYEDDGDTLTAGPIVFTGKMKTFTKETKVENGLCAWTGGIGDPVTTKANNVFKMGYALFKVREGVESTTAQFKFSDNTDKNFVASTDKGSGKVDYISSVSFGTTASVTINGATPTLNTVTLNKNTVTVNGTDGATVNATAASVQSTNLTSMVNWTVAPANSGVSIDNAGVITVAKNAKADDYTIPATGKDD